MLRPSAIAIALSALPLPAVADVRLPAVIGDHMVLQQRSEVPLWGWAEPGEAIAVAASWGASAATVADASGVWGVTIATPPAGGPHALELRGRNRLALEDVLVGEVWLCSGQSNMEMSISDVPPGYYGVADPERELAAADRPRIRLFDVQNAIAPAPRADCEGAWRACTRESVAPFSAVGYFFGRELERELDVPIGLIAANWGGTVAESWTSAEGLAAFPEFQDGLALAELLRAEPARIEAELAKRRAAWWSALAAKDAGSRGGRWSLPDFDDAEWRTMDVPRAWESGGLDFDGIAWFRREVVLPAGWAGRELALELGPVDDMDTTFLDGRKVGGLEREGEWRTPRSYRVPAELATEGRHVIAVRVLDTGGSGGLCGEPGDLKLGPADGRGSTSIPLAGRWRWRAGAPLAQLDPLPSTPSFHANSPTALFNGMIAPLAPYAIRGAIWYQGESNRTRARQYRRLFPALIADWRAHFGRGDFPFYFVQIAPFHYGGDRGEAAELRDAQRLALAVPNTGMAVTMDIGDPNDIHPKEKREVGWRLALWALAQTYGDAELECSGPLYRGMSLEGTSIRLEFDHVGGGLVALGGELTHFTIAGPDRRFVAASAMIDGEGLLVSSPEVPRPVAVRYGWGAADEPNLFNAAGLPASSFRTDDWPVGGE